MVADNPALFRVHTPIHIDIFENLLKRHPNPDFVTLVCTGLPEGFWPWADTLSGGFPTTHMNLNQCLLTTIKLLSWEINALKNNTKGISLSHLELICFLACTQCQSMLYLSLTQKTYNL